MDPVFFAAGANAEPGAFDEAARRIAYGSGRNVVVVDGVEDVEQRRFSLIPEPPAGHVHSVQFVEQNPEILLIGADDGSVSRFRLFQDQKWHLERRWKLPDAVMICRQFQDQVFAVTSKAQLFALSSHHSDDCEARVIFSAGAGKKLTSLACGQLPDGSLILAVGMSDCSIRLLSPEGQQLLSLAGHQNWTSSLQFQLVENGRILMLLSASLDKTVRLWKLSRADQSSATFASATVATSAAAAAAVLKELVPQQNTFNGWRCELDAVALGHENAVYFAKFVQDSTGALMILSGSSDKSVILWREGFAGAWVSEAQLSEASDYTLLFVGGSLLCQGNCLVAVASTGSVMLWRRDNNEWTPSTPITGHTGAVEQCTWLPATCAGSNLPILLTCSVDQTTRAFSISAHLELSRPQIHGYDLKCLAAYAVPETGAIEIVSGADEKVLRVFAAPDQFYTRAGLQVAFPAPAAAQLPALGLSNKLLSNANEGYNSAFAPTTRFPHDRELMRQSLWPEVDKLYAHNRELSCLAIDSQARWMASAAKGTKVSDAAVCIWSRASGSWKLQETLELHKLTVTNMAFSGDGTKLLVVSRDRSLSLVRFGDAVEVSVRGFEAHSRQIWAAAWIDNDRFITGGREGVLKWWKVASDNNSVECVKQVQFEAAICSVAVNPDSSVIAVGDERGKVFIHAATASLDAEVSAASFTQVLACAESIVDLKWNGGLLAVVSADRSVRVLRLQCK